MLIQGSVSVPANSQIDDVVLNNIIAANRNYNSAVEYGITASATGLLTILKAGVVDIAPEFSPSLQNRIPVYPDDFLGTFGLFPNDRLSLRVRNTTGGALTLFWSFRFRPV